ncbi:hypothetical protein FQA47_021356 [Oryzias melastigma]|uniref:Ciliary neurotrophic factor n=1 Tax=Oryzias melastigma TaxID=30732 RepID=A0A834FJK8_ORYME|nr:hypothetical protein FQA47_021356 [Oryzias melastigma]
MNSVAGFLRLVYALVVLAQGSAARLKKQVLGPGCKPKNLILITKIELESCLSSFEDVNGKHLGTWSPGFPELDVHQNAPLDGAKVQCGLSVVAQGLEKVLEQQKHLYQNETVLKKWLKETTLRVQLLGQCLQNVLGGECFPKPSLPEMPRHLFERKQWGHTLLKAAERYVGWLYDRFTIEVLKSRQWSRIKHKVLKAELHNYKLASKYLL